MHHHRAALLTVFCCLTAIAAQDAKELELERPGENLALGCPYTIWPAARYSLTADPDDQVQLTDGLYTTGYFWTSKSTVGWNGVAHLRVVIDLGSIQPIGGLSYRTAAGRAGVEWPAAMHLFVSDDNDQWSYSGEVLGLCNDQHGAPPTEFAVHRYWTDQLKLHGRYLAVVVVPTGAYSFCDEIEVYQGADALLTQPREMPGVKGLDDAVTTLWYQDLVRGETSSLQAQLEALPPAQRAQAAAAVKEAHAAVSQVTAQPTGVIPFNRAHRRVLRAQAALWRAMGRPATTIWAGCRWDPLDVNAPPPANPEPVKLTVTLLRNEVRGVTCSIANATDSDRSITVRVAGDDGARPPWLRLLEVAPTAVRPGKALEAAPDAAKPRVVGAALPDATPGAEGWQVELVSGLTKQLWLSVDGRELPAGTIQRQLELVEGDALLATVPLTVRVSKLTMPDQTTLAISGWDYTDGPGRDINAESLDSVVKFLQEHGVNSTWATGASMPPGKYDQDGHLTEKPDTKRFDAWVARWPNAKFYCVFNAMGADLPDTPEGKQRATEWIGFWAEHVTELGKEPSQLALLLVDEPYMKERDDRIVSWAKVIREAQPEVQIFNDPIWRNPGDLDPQVLELSGIMSPNRVRWLEARNEYEAVYLPQRSDQRRMAFYSCSGPVRALDPYSYHRLQAWECFRYGGMMSSFWAFSDAGGGSSWNEYTLKGNSYAPQFLSAEGCTDSKHMAAIRESAYDFEYLTMLQQAVEGRTDAAAQAARKLLESAPSSVLDADGAHGILWTEPKDRSLADQVRLQVLEALERLAQ